MERSLRLSLEQMEEWDALLLKFISKLASQLSEKLSVLVCFSRGWGHLKRNLYRVFTWCIIYVLLLIRQLLRRYYNNNLSSNTFKISTNFLIIRTCCKDVDSIH